MNEEVRKWLEDNPDFKLINVRAYAWDKADEWFKTEFEDQYPHATLYQEEKYPDGHVEYSLKEPFTDEWSDKADEIEEELLHFEYEEKE